MGRDGENFDFGEALLGHDSVVSLRLLLRRELRWLDFATLEKVEAADAMVRTVRNRRTDELSLVAFYLANSSSVFHPCLRLMPDRQLEYHQCDGQTYLLELNSEFVCPCSLRSSSRWGGVSNKDRARTSNIKLAEAAMQAAVRRYNTT